MSATWHGRAVVPTAAGDPRAATAKVLGPSVVNTLGPSAVTTLGPSAVARPCYIAGITVFFHGTEVGNYLPKT